MYRIFIPPTSVGGFKHERNAIVPTDTCKEVFSEAGNDRSSGVFESNSTKKETEMANQEHTRGGSHEQHVKAGEESHKNNPSQSGSNREKESSGTRGGSHEQHVKAGEQSHKNK
jgi:hypothetical protein